MRPFSAIRHVYGDDLVTTWGGPGAGTTEIPARTWQSYLPEADHPEYPSGSTCGCFATAQAMRRFTGTGELNWSVSYPAGTSRIEPGVTPARDLTLHFETWTDFAENCGQARVWGGVHFPAAVETSVALCSSFGDTAFEYYTTLMDGTAPVREPAQALEVDPWLAASTRYTAQVVQVPAPTTPTPEACEAVSDSIVVTAVNSGIECRPLDTSGLQLLTGFLDAVDISGEVNLGVQVCFRDSGSLIFLDMSAATPRITELTTYQVSGMTCGWIDQPGTVVLVASAFPVTSSDGSFDASRTRLPNCEVVTTSRLNFRAEPSGPRLSYIIPELTKLTATARTADWFNVQYQGKSGWISADYVDTEGTC